ncbi:MAG: hypothetical protein CBD16_02505 [Betaproteobacteria bacterium TMED156]|nr:MAG: hypothetical protein CBD16_02505 [Betaproteobacteria bacterium TMED156]
MSKQSNQSLVEYGNGIYALDSGYFRKEFASIHLIVEKNIVAIVDTGTNYSVSFLLEALTSLKLNKFSVEWILLTHVHLDHAGGAGKMMSIFPNAKLTVHKRGVRHMIDPTKLWNAVIDVYGLKEATNQYGSLIPIRPDRIVEVGEGDTIRLGNRVIEFWDAPGHAKHHVFIRDSKTRCIFTGDTYGISYKELNSNNGSFAFVSATPSQFDPVDAQNSIRRIMTSDAPSVFLTHYSRLTNIEKSGNQLLRLVNDYVEIAEKSSKKENVHSSIGTSLTELLFQNAIDHGVNLPKKVVIDLLKLDIGLNASGLVSWLDRK